MYYLCSGNKGADQLPGYREADLRLCFSICKMPVFSRRGSCILRCSLSVFTMEPEDQAIIFGQDLFLHCSAVNITTGTDEGLLMQWRLDGSPVSQKTSMFANFTLLVPSISNSDLGNYTCVVLDQQDSVILESKLAAVFPACKLFFCLGS